MWALLSDAVLNNLITTLGAVVTAGLPTIAALWSGRRTRKHINHELEDVRKEMRRIRGDDDAAGAGALERDILRAPEQEPRSRRPLYGDG